MQVSLADVLKAVKKDELVPFFQPIVELRTGVLRGFEVLARWKHPGHGTLLPPNFITLAEENGLIGEVTQQICSKAFQASHLIPNHLTLAVNVSPVQMRDLGLPAQMRQSAEDNGFPFDRLIIEITESALHHDLPRAQKVAAALKDMGCKLALDDFGTGYSSLRHLQSLEFDEIKIDRSFVDDMTSHRKSRKIVAAILGLGQSLGLETIAEGVETEEQADMLIWLGCELAQGYRYGRPEGVENLAEVIAAEPIASPAGLTTPGDDWATSSLEALPTLRLAQLQAIYDGAPVGLCFLDNKFRYVNLNKRLAEMNGRPIKEHLGCTVRELYPDWFPIYEPFLLRALAGEAISNVELRRPRTGFVGDDRDLIASYQPAWDETDEVIGISISLLDVTDHRGGVTLFPADLQGYSSEINSESPWVMDGDGNDLQTSAHWVQITPLGKDRTRNLHWLEAVHGDDLENTIKVMKHALRTGKPIDVEYRVLGVDGGWRWMRSTGSPRFGPTGQITRWYGSVEDINDRKMQPDLSQPTSEYQQEEHDTLAKGVLLADTLQRSGEAHED